jgi:hypothetical protein
MTLIDQSAGERGTCRSCGAVVYWMRNDLTGKTSPFDPVEACGACDGQGCKKCRGEGRLQRSHFATCPDAAQWRKAKKR